MPKNQPELKLISLEDVVVEPVRWLWYPYIPLGKLTILHGDPGEGKTTLALWIAAACSRGQALPGGETGEPLTILYQTAEDGLGDTIKPRLLESKADLQKIYTIDETDFPLSMLDHRIGEAIEKTQAQLMILDPMQAYLGEKVDMNRANEVRTVMKGLTKVANQTGCAIVLSRLLRSGDLHRLPPGRTVRLAVERLLLCGSLHLESGGVPLPQRGAGERRGGGAHQKWPQPVHDHLLLRGQHAVEPARLPEAYGQGEPPEGQPLPVRQRPGGAGSPRHLHQTPAEDFP